MRFGELIAFGTIQFSGVGAVSRAVSGWPLTFEASYDTSLISTGRSFPFDVQGLSAAPMKDPQISYEYILLAPYGLSEGRAFAEVERQWRVIFDALASTYVWNGATASGQKGDLLIADADPSTGTTYKATARILAPAPFKLVRGAPRHLVVELKFALLSDFVII